MEVIIVVEIGEGSGRLVFVSDYTEPLSKSSNGVDVLNGVKVRYYIHTATELNSLSLSSSMLLTS